MTRILTVGHRGVGCSIPGTLSLLPENSLSSFREARRLGADGIELDVFLSKKNEVLVLHGYAEANSLCLTALANDTHSGNRAFTMKDTVEDYDGLAKDLLLRRPWLTSSVPGEVARLLELHRANTTESFKAYSQCLDTYGSETVPTLQQVLEEFGEDWFYNIELKGSRPALGERVLEILKGYPKARALISSFNWFAPELDPSSELRDSLVERNPSDSAKVDLLGPLVGNKQEVPLGLLFNGNHNIPSIGRMVQCAKSYGASWINLPQNFWKLPKPILGCDKEGADALKHVVSELHKHDLKVMSYFLESTLDTEEDFRQHMEAKVDALCANDVAGAIKVTRG